ncbi:hypothetical protein AMTRI_Chr12g235980 [Amborella trichopoda]|uniref:Uncharacterized protein n=1 Tax=Amborella trichopoda TaxID=13333 RepID=W1PED3_AMBTC|nr:uncharacterized protein LOC18434179 [Amborella trichopoda]ERN05991.1 hypothetical protein AMTR_s00143p00072070 [Amborella trichopoda]|eukprot:XP_006844316.1 uncharacterized protein LOC18434179 [Amborella trichopoda]
MDVCAWIESLPNPDEWPDSTSPPHLELCTTTNKEGNPKSLLFRAERTAGSNTEALVTFSLCAPGFWPSPNTLWVSNPCPLLTNSMERTLLPLLLQLLEETIARAPDSHMPSPRVFLQPSVAAALLAQPYTTLSAFFNFAFACRLFWLCAFDAPADVGSLYFRTLASGLDVGSCKEAMRSFFLAVGADLELQFMRALAYALTKSLLLKDLGSSQPDKERGASSYSYIRATSGFLALKGYAPLLALRRATKQRACEGLLETGKSVLRYVLAHQQLEVIVQFEYSVKVRGDHAMFRLWVDNVRVDVTRLGFGAAEELIGEKHFPSRISVMIGPEVSSGGSVVGLSLSKSTANPERKVENKRTVKGSFGKSKIPTVNAMASTSTRERLRSWNVEQYAEGSTVVFDAALCDNTSGSEVASLKQGVVSGSGEPKSSFRRRYSGTHRAFNKMGGVILTGNECGEGVSWRLLKEVVGSVMKWKLGAKVWVSYFPNDCNTSYFETRYVEWFEEVSLHVIDEESTLVSTKT